MLSCSNTDTAKWTESDTLWNKVMPKQDGNKATYQNCRVDINYIYFINNKILTNRQKKQIDREPNKQTNRQTDKKQTHKQTDTQTNKQTNKQTEDKQTDRQTNKQTNRQTDRQTDRQTVTLLALYYRCMFEINVI